VRASEKPGAAVDAKRINKWIKRFGGYRDPVTKQAVEDWLSQFNKDRDLAARVLDVVEFFALKEIYTAYRQALDALAGWHSDPSKRTGKWRFAAMSRSAGESGDSMLHHFRVANQLDRASSNELFVHRSALLTQGLGADDTVVLLDDFSGTGNQICEAWNDPQVAFGELLADVGQVYLILVASTNLALKKIAAETRLSVIPTRTLTDSDNIFSKSCKHFSEADRECLLRHCKRASARAPMGFGDGGLVVVFQHRTPNNTIPVLHVVHEKWTGLFPRHD
jgi:hypothetical protein